MNIAHIFSIFGVKFDVTISEVLFVLAAFLMWLSAWLCILLYMRRKGIVFSYNLLTEAKNFIGIERILFKLTIVFIGFVIFSGVAAVLQRIF